MLPFRWTDIIEQVTNSLGAKSIVARAEVKKRDGDQWPRVQPMAIEDVEKLIEKHKPRVVFAPHVETSTGVELPLEYIKRKGEMSPPFPNVKLKNGVPLDSKTFPVLVSS